MTSRRRFLSSFVVIPLLGAVTGIAACGGRPLISDLRLSGKTVVPDGSGLQDEVNVGFTVFRRAEVSATLQGPDGKQYVLRDPQLRAPDDYQIAFKGIVPVPGKTWLRVLPNGAYTIQVQARDAAGGSAVTRQASVQVKDADTTAPSIEDLMVNLPSFSPNGDGVDDTVQMSFRLTKAAEIRVYATDANDGFYLIEPPTKSIAKDLSFTWDGTAGGGAVLKDGTYTIHVEATDAAGNFTDATTPVKIENGGTPRAEIVDVRFAPTALATGMDLHVSITVKNSGTVPLKTSGPPPSQKYTTSQTFASFPDPQHPNTPLWYERPGVWRVAVDWQNSSGQYPVRWGFFEDLNRELQPGETVTVNGIITVLLSLQQHDVIFWAALEQGGVGYVDTQTGQKHIAISH